MNLCHAHSDDDSTHYPEARDYCTRLPRHSRIIIKEEAALHSLKVNPEKEERMQRDATTRRNIKSSGYLYETNSPQRKQERGCITSSESKSEEGRGLVA
jgi:hypothetical protein